MAQFTKTNGDFQPVAVYDAAAYVNTALNTVTSAVTVQPQGPKLDFFTFTAAGALTGANVANAVLSLQQLGTIYMYEYTSTGTDTVAVGMYPTGAWTTATITAAMTATGDAALAGGATTATATFTN
jgi:hypothetical protein